MRLISNLLFILLCFVIVSCNSNIEEPNYTNPKIVKQQTLSVSNTSGLKSNNSEGFTIMMDTLDREFDETKVEHKYVTTGYTVTIYNAWVSDSTGNSGHYEDLVFENINLNDQSIDFETLDEFSVEVIHPDFSKDTPSKEAYYGYPVTVFTELVEKPLVIPVELKQFAVLLVYRNSSVEQTLEYAKVEDIEVDEYESVYIKPNGKFDVIYKHQSQLEQEDSPKAGKAGECKYFWLEEAN